MGTPPPPYLIIYLFISSLAPADTFRRAKLFDYLWLRF
jgi:hypothetical protein